MPRLALVLLFVLGCFGDNPPIIYPTTAPLDDSQLTLGPGDKVELVVYAGTRQTKAAYMLDASGEMEIQYIGTITAGGKTASKVQDEIRAKLADGYLNEPIVSLTIVEINSRKLSVFGQVLKSGTIKFTPGMMITEAIAQSGGFAPMARKNMVKVIRKLDGRSETYKIPVEKIAEGSRPNFPMMPGDQVFVPERPW
ncbi:MAG: polysaccharide export protein [Myxococcota bacterium]|nr:polysaccharide export protein [Deltaproteobacteria bacterium]MDQ3339388.1 polysaccharide export protein [Myxococcota bacterium]